MTMAVRAALSPTLALFAMGLASSKLRARAEALKLPQPHAVDYVIRPFAQDEIGALARRNHILAQVNKIDRLPDAVGSGMRLLVGERGISMEVGLGIAEGGVAQ